MGFRRHTLAHTNEQQKINETKIVEKEKEIKTATCLLLFYVCASVRVCLCAQGMGFIALAILLIALRSLRL